MNTGVGILCPSRESTNGQLAHVVIGKEGLPSQRFFHVVSTPMLGSLTRGAPASQLFPSGSEDTWGKTGMTEEFCTCRFCPYSVAEYREEHAFHRVILRAVVMLHRIFTMDTADPSEIVQVG